MKKLLMITGLFAIALAMAVAAVGGINDKPTQNPKNDPGTTAVNTNSTTGNFTTGIMPKRNPDGTLALSKEMQNAVSTSHEGLFEEPAPGGGIMVDLQGRFRSLSIATTDADGNLTVRCLSGTVVPTATKANEQTENHSTCCEKE